MTQPMHINDMLAIITKVGDIARELGYAEASYNRPATCSLTVIAMRTKHGAVRTPQPHQTPSVDD